MGRYTTTMYHLAREQRLGAVCGRRVGGLESAPDFWAHSPLLRCRNCERVAIAAERRGPGGETRTRPSRNRVNRRRLGPQVRI